MKNFKLPLSVKIFGGLFVIGMVYSLISSVFNGFIGVFNQSVDYGLEYKALEQNQITTYDNYYLAFNEKSDVANINKETFLNVTNIIMQARTDGPGLAWKWVHENQNIPYSEFTSFYKELSGFITQRFAENNAIERNKQSVVRKQNEILTTFPGIVYNYFMNIPLLEYHKGFVSIESAKLFAQK